VRRSDAGKQFLLEYVSSPGGTTPPAVHALLLRALHLDHGVPQAHLLLLPVTIFRLYSNAVVG
jgi:hypothetical protein